MTRVLYFASRRHKSLLVSLYLACRRARLIFVTLGWGVCLASLTLGTIFQGILVPRGLGGLLPEGAGSPFGQLLFYLGFFGVCVIASLMLKTAGTALLSFFISYALAGAITYWVLVLPGAVGVYPAPDLLIAVMVIFTFSALFPFPLILGLVGTLAGTVLAEFLG